jgi:hypothetical protein
MMDLFLHLLRALVILLLPGFLFFFVIGWVRRTRTNRAFREILIRALFIDMGVGLPICAILAAWLTWWITSHVPAPD